MIVTTKKQILKNLPKHWRQSYPKGRDLASGKNSDKIYIALVNEKELTEERANEIIGNDSWTRNSCDECGEDVEVTVMVGEEPDYESRTASICINCLNKAVELGKFNT